uniref:Uncharacterized protein n=1 Tax=Arundo donax TaxID=35708 RepID=A0A0A9D9N1_ARUDO
MIRTTLGSLGGIAVIARNLGRYNICSSVQIKLNIGDMTWCYIVHTTHGTKAIPWFLWCCGEARQPTPLTTPRRRHTHILGVMKGLGKVDF